MSWSFNSTGVPGRSLRAGLLGAAVLLQASGFAQDAQRDQPSPNATQQQAQTPTQAPTQAHMHAQARTQAARSLRVQPFDETSWAALLQQGPRPAAYLFTTSYCSTCPQAFEVLQRAVRQSRRQIELVAVMMDVDGPQALRHARHFQGLTQLYAFDGFEPAIRQSVDPEWPSITPYVVLQDRQGRLQKTLGPPTPAMLKRWLL